MIGTPHQLRIYLECLVVSLRMFLGRQFIQDMGRWNTSSVTQMAWVFKYTKDFNQDISNWDTSSVKNFNHLFEWANAFDQDISDWNISSAQSMDWMFENSQAISDTNKGKIHQSFASNPNWPYDWSDFVSESMTIIRQPMGIVHPKLEPKTIPPIRRSR